MAAWRTICREPYRLLFPLGAGFGMLGVSHWLWYALKWSPASSSFFHASLQMAAYLYCFIAGFLMTALPRFTSAAPASGRELGGVLALLAAQVACVSAGWWAGAHLCLMGLLLALLIFGRRLISRRHFLASGEGAGSVTGRLVAGPPTEFLWIPLGALMGISGGGLMLLETGSLVPAWWAAFGRLLAHQGFVTSVVVGVAGFMAPRLMGQEILRVTPADRSLPQARRIRRRRVWLHAASGAGLLVSFVLEAMGWVRWGYLLRAGVVTAELSWMARPHQVPRPTELYVRLIWLSLWMVMLGFWAAGLWPRYRVAMLHLVWLGGFSLMAFAVGTMVVFSHAGAAERLRGPLPLLRLTAAGVLTALAARVAADLIPAFYFPLLAAAAIAWLAGAVSWLAMILPLVSRTIPEGAFERMHDAAKQRVRLS